MHQIIYYIFCILVPLTEFSKESLEKHINLNDESWQWDHFLFPYFTILCINRTFVQRQILTETHLWHVTITMQVLREDLLYYTSLL